MNIKLSMTPQPGDAEVRFVGDHVAFTLSGAPVFDPQSGWVARLRTTIGRGRVVREEVLQACARKFPLTGTAWRDLSMRWDGRQWFLTLPLAEVGHFKAKAYVVDCEGRQQWPVGEDVGINVLPDWCRTANTVYCAFPRMFGPNKNLSRTVDEERERNWRRLDDQGYTIIPPSGKFRDLITELPHVLKDLGCRILHLLPVSPTPTTLAKFGRFGSPYALQDFTAIDPALVEFDKRTTGVEQFMELTREVHHLGGRVMLDMVVNHTGWGSTLFENRPEWFVREDGGEFASPGAWGTVWEDLVEIDPWNLELWDVLAAAFIVWCRRGVDGFRCDAGYKVPLPVWQYVTASVRREFPDTIFLLEGLGGGWEETASRMQEGGLQWAYSELFQNYSPAQVCGYLDHALAQNRKVGLLLNYSETHDNERLASKSRAWSLLRNSLCALAGVNGGYGFTNGVEWCAPEKVNVHSARGLAWGNPENLVGELARLNGLICGHPCFFDHAEIRRLTGAESSVLLLLRESAEGLDAVLVAVNLDDRAEASVLMKPGLLDGSPVVNELNDAIERGNHVDLLGLFTCSVMKKDGGLRLQLPAAGAACFASRPEPAGLAGEAYRRARARAAWAFGILHDVGLIEAAPIPEWRPLAKVVDEDPVGFLSHVHACSLNRALEPAFTPSKGDRPYASVVEWRADDVRRIVPVPPAHWLVFFDEAPFRVRLVNATGEREFQREAIPTSIGWLVAVAPGEGFGDAAVRMERLRKELPPLNGAVRFLDPAPQWPGNLSDPLALSQTARETTVLLTNGRGGMARVNLSLGEIRSKYDCLLGANLNPELPVDRHVFVKRIRIWANANGFITALDADVLLFFEPGPPACWRFLVPAGDGRSVEIQVRMDMVEEENTVLVEAIRLDAGAVGEQFNVSLVARLDLEDRSFHEQTERNDGAEHHFSTNTTPLESGAGFHFTPADDRALKAVATAGRFHVAPEWSQGVAHPVEAGRGQPDRGDAWSPGWFELPVDQRDVPVEIRVTAEGGAGPSPVAAVAAAAFQDRDQRLRTIIARAGIADDDAFGKRLVVAAQQFLVKRGEFKSVIAGYPWFLDWGRDTLICARGLIAAGWLEEVLQLLIVFGRFEENGTLPNTIHGADASNRDTSDAPLWYGVVAEELAAAMGPEVFATEVDGRRTVRDVLVSIAKGYLAGTRNQICVDRDSSLVWSPAHFTWMDTNFPAGTPREGYPIEIQALWIRLLNLLASIDSSSNEWGGLAGHAGESLMDLYWLEESGWFADVLLADPRTAAVSAVRDEVLRSNCLIPISLGLLAGERARHCVEATRRHLVIPGALRSLAPLPARPPLPIHANHGGGLLNDPANPYWGRYEGDEDTRRKPAYHNGTAWTWTFPVFCEALFRAYPGDRQALAAAKSHLGSMDRLLREGCFGQLPEVLDGDAPHVQRGCDAQAWGVTEAIRVRKLLLEA